MANFAFCIVGSTHQMTWANVQVIAFLPVPWSPFAAVLTATGVARREVHFGHF
jgi:hypothetical protein